MKISARNVFKGKVTALKTGAVNAEVSLTTSGGDRIVAIVTNESVKSLGLAIGAEATALVKASSVLVMTDGHASRLSARNCLPGKITSVTQGPVSAEVTIALTGGANVHATITRESAIDMALRAGAEATAVIKASSVILAVGA
jgi:molybdate transport system regulatory protein